MKKVLQVLFLTFFLVVPVFAENSLLIIGEDLPPLSYLNEKGELDGMTVELVDELLNRTDETTAIQLLPWARAYEIAKNRSNTILFTMANSEERSKHFTMMGPVVCSRLNLFSSKDVEINVRNLDDIWDLKAILVNRNTIGHQLLQEWGMTNLIVTETAGMLVEMLISQRVAIGVMDDITLNEQLRSLGKPKDSLKQVYTPLAEIRFYIAFSRGTSGMTIRSWVEAFRDIRANGTFERIFRKWFPLGEIPGEMEVIGYGSGDY